MRRFLAAVGVLCWSLAAIAGDPLPPTAVCQDYTVYLDSSGFASISPSDVDGGSFNYDTLSLDVSSFSCADVGNVTVTLTAENGSGSDSCQATVTVVDDTGPDAFCRNATIYLDSSGYAYLNEFDVDDGSSDSCGIASYSLNQTVFDCSYVGQNEVTLTVTDVNGNPSTCNATVTVADDAPPSVYCQPATVDLDSSGNGTVNVYDLDDGSFDNCGIDSLSASPNSFTCLDLGNMPVTLTVTDVNGNSATCDTTVNVRDVTPPQITTCASDDSSIGDVNDQAPVPDFTGGVSASDACSTPTVTQDPQTGAMVGLGPHTITLYASDGNGNTGSCSATFTVVSNQASSVGVDSNEVPVAEGSVAINSGTFGDDVDAGLVQLAASVGVLTTNVGLGTWAWSFATTDGPDESQTVTITATDDANHTTVTNFTLTVTNVPPTVAAGADTNQADVRLERVVSFTDPGQDIWTATVNYGDGSQVDAPPVDALNQLVAFCHVYEAGGVHTVTVTVADGDAGGLGSDAVQATLNLTVQGVPHAWLAARNLTNGFDAEAAADQDADGQPTWVEYFSATEPTNGQVFLRSSPMAPVFGTNFINDIFTNDLLQLVTQRIYEIVGHAVSWSSRADRVYALDQVTNLPSQSWVPVAAGIPATPPVNTYTVLVEQGSSPRRSFRVRAGVAPCPPPP